jgi:hypothetical protein
MEANPRELWVFGHSAAAFFAGFGEDRRHRDDKSRNMVAWWPSLGQQAYLGHRFGKVVLTRSFMLQNVFPTHEILPDIRLRTTGSDTIWIQL